MSLIIFDTEDTGLRPGKICQLAYVKVDATGITPHNDYFAVPYMEAAAENVHHLSVEHLAELSGGKTFEDVCHRVLQDFAEAEIVIAHNYAFDSNFMRAEAAEVGAVYRAKGYCTMNRFRDECKLKGFNGRYKNPKLDELVTFFDVKEEEIIALTKELFGDTLGKHDARYDTAALCMVVHNAFCRRVGGLEEYSDLNGLAETVRALRE